MPEVSKKRNSKNKLKNINAVSLLHVTLLNYIHIYIFITINNVDWFPKYFYIINFYLDT